MVNGNEISGKKIAGPKWYMLPLLMLLYLTYVAITTGIRVDHIYLGILIIGCFYLSGFTRRFITGFSIFIVYWILYDSMKAWPNWAFNEIDIVPLYNLEKTIFGITVDGKVLTPNEYLMMHTSLTADIISALFYLCWVPVPLLFAFYLYKVNKNLFLRFSLAFFLVNCIGFVIYYVHPAAPPWYISEHGIVADVYTKSYAAGLLRFDNYFGIHLFEGLYAKGSNVFAAMPSLHASYPLIGFYYSLKQPVNGIKIFFAVVMVGIWIAAIYLNHHYILDVIAGIVCGVIGLYFLEGLIIKNTGFKNFLKSFQFSISTEMEKIALI
jgi:inositol phosphorylceramide synthase catalytic subunit